MFVKENGTEKNRSGKEGGRKVNKRREGGGGKNKEIEKEGDYICVKRKKVC